MKVLFVQGAAERGGGERVLLALTRNLPEAGVEPVVAFLADGPFVAEVEQGGVATIALPDRVRLRQPWKAGAVVRAIADAARNVNADVVHGNGEKMALFTAWAASRARIPAVSWLHDAPRRDVASTALQAALRLAPASTYVACSPWLAAEYGRQWRVPVRSVPNGIDLTTLPAHPTDPRRLAGWSPETTVIGHFGRLQQWKGADVFLRAAAQVAPDHPDARFLVVGGALYGWEQQYAESLPHLARKVGLGDRVHFAGHRDDALALMAGCDVVVHSSVRDEPFGLVIAEAMALGRAVVATRSGGPEGIVDHGHNGTLTAPRDAGELRDALAHLLAHPELRSAYGTAARAAAVARFSAPAMADGFASLYKELQPSPATVTA